MDQDARCGNEYAGFRRSDTRPRSDEQQNRYEGIPRSRGSVAEQSPSPSPCRQVAGGFGQVNGDRLQVGTQRLATAVERPRHDDGVEVTSSYGLYSRRRFALAGTQRVRAASKWVFRVILS